MGLPQNLNENICLTCVPDRNEKCQAEDCIDEEEADHLPLRPLVSPPVFLNRDLAMVPVLEGTGDVGVGDDVDCLLEDAPLLLPEIV